jgi:hypothetical protein
MPEVDRKRLRSIPALRDAEVPSHLTLPDAIALAPARPRTTSERESRGLYAHELWHTIRSAHNRGRRAVCSLMTVAGSPTTALRVFTSIRWRLSGMSKLSSWKPALGPARIV